MARCGDKKAPPRTAGRCRNEGARKPNLAPRGLTERAAVDVEEGGEGNGVCVGLGAVEEGGVLVGRNGAWEPDARRTWRAWRALGEEHPNVFGHQELVEIPIEPFFGERVGLE